MKMRSAGLFLFLCLWGCSASSTPPVNEHDHASEEHQHHLESLADGIDQLQTQLDQIKAAFDAGTPNECDSALHEAVHILDQLPKVADVKAMDSEDQAIIEANCKDMFGHLGKIHDGFHGGGEVNAGIYDTVADDIASTMKNLRSKLSADTPE